MFNQMMISLQAWNPAGSAPGPKPEVNGQVCVANIDAAGRRQRLMAGGVSLMVGVGGLAVLLAIHANPLWRVPLLLLFGSAAAGFFQWRDRT